MYPHAYREADHTTQFSQQHPIQRIVVDLYPGPSMLSIANCPIFNYLNHTVYISGNAIEVPARLKERYADLADPCGIVVGH